MDRRARSAALFVPAVWLAIEALAGCGYRPLHASALATEGERLAVLVVSSHVTPTSAADEVAGGVREALSESGALRSGTGYPRVEVEVVRIDQESDAIADLGGAPRARAVRVGVVARAWIKRAASEPATGDTGDVRAFSVVAADAVPALGSELVLERAARASGRRAGLRLGARLLGHPAASE
jgi:hypothetical protein